MALSPDLADAKPLFGIRLPRILSLDLQRQPDQRDVVSEAGALINQRGLTREAFGKMKGRPQERYLLFLLKTGNLALAGYLREDFHVEVPVSWEERAESFLVGELIRRNTPIVPSSESAPNSIFDQIHALSYPIDRQELAARLERERLRVQEFPKVFFTPAEDLGPFSAARRYYTSLVMALDTSRTYTRDFFAPLYPIEKEGMSPREKRAQAAFYAYQRETALPGTWA